MLVATGARTAEDVNRGQVIGWSKTRTGVPHAFIWEASRMRDLGTLNGQESHALASNERGEVVGTSETTSMDADGHPISHVFRWQNGRMRDLGIASDVETWLYINDRGQVAGDMELRNGNDHAFLWESGKLTDLGTLGGFMSGARDINERGQVIGWRTVKSNGDVRWRAFLWENGRMRDLGTLGGLQASATDISERGQIVGDSSPKKSDPWGTRAFLWQNGKMRDLGGLSRSGGSSAYAIDSRGRIAGECDYKDVDHVCLWDRGKVRDLGLHGYGLAMNERGQITTHTLKDDFRVAVWDSGRWTTLGAPRGRRDCQSVGINNRGDVVGNCGTFDLDVEGLVGGHAVLWTYKS